MLQMRRSTDRGHADHGWLNTYHSFSFADYYDPNYMGFRHLRVINEDRVYPGRGFPTHPHRDMEIISYVLEGALEHKDSMGNGSIIVPGDVQRMSAGTGITHSEFNHSKNELVHFLQIWIVPRVTGVQPSYEQKNFSDEDKMGRLRLIASADGRDGSVSIHQDVDMYAALLEAEDEVSYLIPDNHHVWLQVARGMVEVNGQQMGQGDGVAVSEEDRLVVIGANRAEVLVFDLV